MVFLHLLLVGLLQPLGRGVILHEVPVDDEAVGLLGEVESVAELDLGSGLAPDEDMQVGFVEAEDLFGVSDAALADDALVRLVDGLRQLVYENKRRNKL